MPLTPEESAEIQARLKHSRMKIVRDWLIIAGVIAVVFGLAWWTTWKSKPSPAPEEARKALQALQKIKAATEVGVSYTTYQQLVIEAKTEVNAASIKLPTTYPKPDKPYDLANAHARLNEDLNKAMDVYADARRVWSEKISDRKLSKDTEPGKTIIPKYELTTTDPEQALQILWETGSFRTMAVSGAINSLDSN